MDKSVKCMKTSIKGQLIHKQAIHSQYPSALAPVASVEQGGSMV